ncbi:HAD family hydrolase [Sedimentibacter sp. MB31-C6]|uniref:HAD family hydrolase n=1 Tax=Sedimentibacter sp. MB31-C6 TaxID=3109366 RepID=UPI002DDD0082|nr:HAD hydrolase family protein [Sedimentibacter sp. MB36-C1]WSI03588.1 HAD hydrolase family protein [Sedimentibacter sp. MB36-C1]
MININIPGRCDCFIENIVFDFNGTIAVNGKIEPSIKEKISILCNMANVYVLTADTYGSAAMECQGLNLNLKTFPNDKVADYKAKIVNELGKDKTICFGNGYNDIKMFEIAALSVAVLEKEGTCSSILKESDVMVKSIDDGINLLLNPKALIATLRA